MPYTDRTQQLNYMKEYMQRKRMATRLEKMKLRKQRLLEQVEREPWIKHLLGNEKPGSYIDQEIERLEGLLKIRLNCPILGGTSKP